MRVGFLSQWYAPETGSAALPTVIANTLHGDGHDVTVVTGLPNYPNGQLYPGYRIKVRQTEMINSLPIHRAPHYLSHDSNAGRRVANYLSFAGSASVVAARQFKSADAVWVHSTPATAAIPALTAKLLHRVPFVLHIQDLWPETVTATGMLSNRPGDRLETVIHRFCDTTYRHAAHIAITAPGMRASLRRRGVPDEKITDLPNWCNEAVFQPVNPSPEVTHLLGPRRPFTVMYAGSLGDVQGLETVIGAAERLRFQRDVGFILVGNGVAKQRLIAECRRLGLDNITFVEGQPLEKMADVLALGDVQLISLRDLPLYRITLPSKVQATLAAGRPIICSASGDAASVIIDAGAGLTVPPEEPYALADAILRVRDLGPRIRADWGACGRHYYEQHLGERQALATMNALLGSAAGARK